MEEKKSAKDFFDELLKDDAMQKQVKQGIEKTAKDAGFVLTEDEIEVELRKRWGATKGAESCYSEPPGF